MQNNAFLIIHTIFQKSDSEENSAIQVKFKNGIIIWRAYFQQENKNVDQWSVKKKKFEKRQYIREKKSLRLIKQISISALHRG